MKTKTYSLPLLTLLCITAFYFTSCKPNEQSPCIDASNTIVNLTAIELSKVPYTGFDTLYFLSKTGDTNIVVGGGKQYYYDTKYSTQPPDCPQNQTTQYQAYKINFIPTKGDLSFTLKIRKIDNSLYIISIKYPIVFDESFSSLGKRDLTYFYYVDSLKINSINYTTINRLIPRPNIGPIDNSYFLYYDLNKGVLLIRSQKDNEEYSIIKK